MYRANSVALLAPALNEVDAYISYSVININIYIDICIYIYM